jgi:hypothetical protein
MREGNQPIPQDFVEDTIPVDFLCISSAKCFAQASTSCVKQHNWQCSAHLQLLLLLLSAVLGQQDIPVSKGVYDVQG